MISVAAISVGSSIFFTLALATISVLVLLLLRRFLTLRATPAYLSIPVFLALALPASVVLLVPIDLASSSRDGGGPKAIWLPERLLLVSWRIAYWLIFVLTWAILPLLGEFIDAGHRDARSRIQYSIRSNARYQMIVLGCATVGLIYISIQNGFKFNTIKALAMALAYVWGLVLAIYLMGHGLVSIPRTLFRNASSSGRLRRIQAHASLLHDRLMDAINDLESLEGQVAQLQRRKTGTARDFQDWIEELAETSTPPESRSGILDPTSSSSTIPAVITERYLADLTRRLQRARHQKARFVDEWDRLIFNAADLQAIINSSASKKLEFGHYPQRSTSFRQLKLLTPYMRYHVYVNVYPNLRLAFGAFFAAASVCVVWSELIKSIAPRLSVVTLSIVSYHESPAPVGFGRQVIASMWLLYMCSAALVGVNDAKVWGNRALVRRNTYGESACWYASLVARLTVPIAYNFVTFLPEGVRTHTTFYRFLGQWINLTPLGKGFDYFFPVLILVPIMATLFNLYGRVRNICGFGLIEEDDDDLENNPSGYGIGGWREGRELIERELNGLGSLGLSPRNGRSPRQSAHVDGNTQAFSSSRTPLAEATRPSRSTRGAVATSSAVGAEEEEEEENFFQSFAHRVRNTIETTSRPQWLQGDSFQFPQWMSNDGSNDGNNGLARWFGGRPANGGQLPHGSQSSLGETCLNYITTSLPSSFHSLHHKFVSPLISAPIFSTPLLRALTSLPDWASISRDDYNKAPAVFTLIACAIALVVMSWRNIFRRSSPPYHPANNTERPYAYLTPDDIVDLPARTYDSNTYVKREDDDSGPDTLILNHRKVTHELQFPPYSINDGALSIGQLRQRAAEITHTADPNRIRLLYKGKLLDKDNLPCRSEGLKQNSEVLCVVSEVQAGARTPSDISEAERTSEDAPRPAILNIPEIQPKPEKKTKRKRKPKGQKKKSVESDDDDLTPPAQPPRPTSSGGRSSLPPSAPNLGSFATPLDQVYGLTSYFHKELLPLCDRYFADPPSDERARDFEHKKLSETVLAQIILKADGIEITTDETRQARRALIKEAQGVLNKLDSAADN
ncbi:LMBR1-like membrane protein-domain-containing protein [Aspergillus cavernicola]|uniref:LMBR1-like membrane protein-domain-containing protein n=1 Tax=Aspergillus cavernicola TaxID=176166 RepID=A0ABR4IE74_9EURO